MFLAEPMAIVCRVSPSFIRFGSFQICTESEDRKGTLESTQELTFCFFLGPSVLLDKLVLPPLLDHVIKHNFQDIYSQKVAARVQHWNDCSFVVADRWQCQIRVVFWRIGEKNSTNRGFVAVRPTPVVVSHFALDALVFVTAYWTPTTWAPSVSLLITVCVAVDCCLCQLSTRSVWLYGTLRSIVCVQLFW